MPYLRSVLDSFNVIMLHFTLVFAIVHNVGKRFGAIFGEALACCNPDFCNSGVEYRYPIRGIDTQIQHWNLGIGTCWGGYRYPLYHTRYRYLLARVSIPPCYSTRYRYQGRGIGTQAPFGT
ncbi:hypothetical protein GQ457_03G020150 [Hibiscus cannabinus]